MLDISTPAPDFTLPQAGGDEVTLSALQGSPVVLYFYPRDDTPGCTKDSVASHEKFTKKKELSVPLLSDENASVCEDYGVWVEKNMYGKKYMGIERATFLIGADGTIAEIWRKVKVPGHAEKVLEAAKAL